jgi:hypothetical protein
MISATLTLMQQHRLLRMQKPVVLKGAEVHTLRMSCPPADVTEFVAQTVAVSMFSNPIQATLCMHDGMRIGFGRHAQLGKR